MSTRFLVRQLVALRFKFTHESHFTRGRLYETLNDNTKRMEIRVPYTTMRYEVLNDVP